MWTTGLRPWGYPYLDNYSTDVIYDPFRRHLRVLSTTSMTRSDDSLGG